MVHNNMFEKMGLYGNLKMLIIYICFFLIFIIHKYGPSKINTRSSRSDINILYLFYIFLKPFSRTIILNIT